MIEGAMRVIVCGAGQVGSTIARHLATEGIDVTVVDLSPEQARRADERSSNGPARAMPTC
jgi:trk system potassium uptake protein TrkA